MKVLKVINRDIVEAIDNNSQIVLLLGDRVGWGKVLDDTVNTNRIQRVFKIESETERERIVELLRSVSREDLGFVDQALLLCEEAMNQKMGAKLYFTLLDHIVFALERIKSGTNFKNQLLREVKKYYPEEFKIGKIAIKFLSEKKDLTIPEDEAGYIALHIANAENELKLPIAETTARIIRNIVRTIEFAHNVKIDENSISYRRFIRHLKNGVDRAFSGKMINDEDEVFFELIREKYKDIYQTASRIARYIYNQYSILLTDDEIINLTIHINRLLESTPS